MRSMFALPADVRWLFWDVDPEAVDVRRDADLVLVRVLEFGRLVDVRWVLATYGRERIHRFFRETGHPELSDRTLTFWRVALHAEEERWARPPSWRRSRIAPWIG